MMGFFLVGIGVMDSAWAYINEESATSGVEVIVTDGITYDEARALIEAMGYEFNSAFDDWESFRRVFHEP